jgi:hypothetical protein
MADWAVPDYLYNPFADKVMKDVVEVMHERFDGRRDELEIVYQKPEQAAALEDQFEMVWGGGCELSEVDRFQTRWPTRGTRPGCIGGRRKQVCPCR